MTLKNIFNKYFGDAHIILKPLNTKNSKLSANALLSKPDTENINRLIQKSKDKFK